MNSLYEELQIILHGLWQRRWVALAVAWGVCLLGWLVVALVPNVYQSRARVFVQADAMLPGSMSATPLDQQKALDQVRQTMTSAQVLERVVRNTALATGARARSTQEIAARAGALREQVKVVSQQDSLFEITATSSDTSLSAIDNARLAAQVAGGLIRAFQETDAAGGAADTSQSLKFIDQQIAARARELQAAEQRRVDFERTYLGAVPGSGSIAARSETMRAEIAQIDSQLVAAQSGLAGINGQLAATPAEIVTTPAGGGSSALAQAEGQLAAGKAQGWTDNHPDVVALKRQIENLRRLGGGAGTTRTPNPAYASLRSMQAERAATVSALQGRKAQIQGDIDAIGRKQVEEPGLAAEQDRLNRDYDAIKQQYDKLLGDREDLRLRGDVQSEGGALRFRVIDPPSVSVIPASPNRPLLLFAVLVAGIAAGLGAAFGLGRIRTTFATVGRLEKATGLPVIGGISQVETPVRAALAQREARWFYVGCGGLGGLCFVLLALEFLQRGLSA